MGLFGNSATITQIHREVGLINDCLRKMERSIELNNGIYESNVDGVAEYFMLALQHQETMKKLLDSITPKEEANLKLAWMDGRYLSFIMWNASYTLTMTQIQRSINKIIEKLGI